jgi:outer membrane protein assembly factor BamB
MRIRFLLAAFLALPSLLHAQTLAATSPGPADFAGVWLGEVVAPNDRTTIGFEFTPGAKGLITTFHMPAMFIARATLGPAQIANGALRFRPLDTALVRDGDKLTGMFGLSHLPVELRRAEKFPDPQPAPTYPAAPAPRWTASLGAETWASPTAADDAIFIGTAAGKLHALDAATGRERWSWNGPNPLYGTAVVTDRRIYVIDSRGDLVALTRDGALAWRLPLHDEKLGGPLKPNETFTHRTPTPVLVAGTLYAGSSDGGVYAIDPAAGKILWRHEANTKIYATLGVDGDDLLVGGFDGTVLVLNRDTRKETARKKLPGPVVSTPVVAAGTVIVGCRDYMLYGLNRTSLAGKWQYSFWFSWVESTPAVVDDIAYLGGSDFARVSALEPEAGEKEWATVVHGLTWGTPLVTNDAVFAGTHAQASAIIPHEAGFVALDRETGAVKWRHIIPLAKGAERAGFLGSPALVGGNVIAVAFDGTVMAWPAK